MPEAEIVAQAIYDAVDTISGDTVATVISMSSHLFETIDDGETEVEAVLRATMSVCRDAARAAIAALDNVRGDGWRTMDDAPMDGQAFLAVVHGQVRVVAYGKTSHVPIMGFCLADQGGGGIRPLRTIPLATAPRPSDDGGRVMGDIGKRYHHIRRGSTYTVIGGANLQTARPASDGVRLTIYRDDATGELWARPTREFHDGRLEEIGPIPDEPYTALAQHAVETALSALGVPLKFGYRIHKIGTGYGGPGEVCGVAIAADGSPRIIVAHQIKGGTGRLMHIYTPKLIKAGDE